jgi:hypothetical protein
MSTYIEYELENGMTVLIETMEMDEAGIVKASRAGDAVKKAEQTFSEALDAISAQAKELKAKLEGLRADEVSVKFGLKVAGEAGNFAIGKVGIEANYEVTLKWENADADQKPKTTPRIKNRYLGS